MGDELVAALASTVSSPEDGATAFVQLLGHKGDVMIIAFRRSFDELGRAQLALSRSGLHSYLSPTSSYVSIVELGMYDMTAKIHRQLADRGLQHDSGEYNLAFEEEMERQRQLEEGAEQLAADKLRARLEAARQRERREAAVRVAEEQRRQAAEAAEQRRREKELYRGEVTTEFLGKFNTSSR